MRSAYSNHFHSLVLQSWIAKKSHLIREIIAGEGEEKVPILQVVVLQDEHTIPTLPR